METIVVHSPIYAASLCSLPMVDAGVISGVLYSEGRIVVRM